ncbi:hypothetical protein [Corynebacterium flavescens]
MIMPLPPDDAVSVLYEEVQNLSRRLTAAEREIEHLQEDLEDLEEGRR